jgi:hypothetical protein
VDVQIEPAVSEPAALRQRIVELDCRLLVIEACEHGGAADEFRALTEHLSCDVLITRLTPQVRVG